LFCVVGLRALVLGVGVIGLDGIVDVWSEEDEENIALGELGGLDILGEGEPVLE
jgi:hypothetical protein